MLWSSSASHSRHHSTKLTLFTIGASYYNTYILSFTVASTVHAHVLANFVLKLTISWTTYTAFPHVTNETNIMLYFVLHTYHRWVGRTGKLVKHKGYEVNNNRQEI